MIRFFTPLIVLIALTLLLTGVGCGPKKIADETTSGCYPENLLVDVNDGRMDVQWNTRCDRLISGYNIYISEEPLTEKYSGAELPGSITPFNYPVYAGDTDPDDGVEHFIAETLENGKEYYVSVRIVNPDRTMSPPSNEVLAICGPRGEIELPIRFKSDKDGYSFERNEYVRVADMANDLYFFSKDGVDYLASPSRLDGFQKENKLGKLNAKGDLAAVIAKLPKLKSDPSKDKLAVKENDWVHVRTPEGTNALVKVLDVSGKGDERTIRLFFAYTSVRDRMVF